MTLRSLLKIAAFLVLLPCGIVIGAIHADAAVRQVKIGVLAHRGAAAALEMWTPTADYLSQQMPGHTFSIVPLGFHEIGPAVEHGDVDFVLANSSIYVELEARYGVNRIATMQNDGRKEGNTVFGGVIFCLADRSDINSLPDLKGKSFLAVDETSFGGWQVALRELRQAGLNPRRDFARLRFAKTAHDDVVHAVLDHQADAGTVRTDTLERMAADGKIDIRAFRVLNQRREKDFPFLLSTRLYPEWPLAALAHTDRQLAEQVIVALFSLPHDGPVARAGKIAGWTIPLDYHPVHELLKELRLRPYQDYGKITLLDVVRLYWRWIALALAALLLMTALTCHVLKLNKRLRQAKQLVEDARSGLEREVQVRTADLKAAVDELRREGEERTRAEEELRRSSELLRVVHENVEIGLSVIGPDMRILSLNKRMRQWFPHIDPGMKPLCYQSFNVPPRAEPCSYCPTVNALRDGEIHEAVTETPSASGVRNYRVVSSPLFAADGSVEATIEMVEDITERLKAESQLKRAEEMSRLYSRDLVRLLAISRETTIATDLKDIYRTFISATKDLLSFDCSTLLLLSADKTTLTVQDCLGLPETLIGHFSLVEGQGLSTLVVKNRKPESVADFAAETRFTVPPLVHEKGIRSGLAVPMMISDEVMGVLIGHTRERRLFSPQEVDIYQLVANQAAVAIRNAMNSDLLRKSERYIRDVTAALGEGVYVLNARGETTFMNPEAEALLGWSEKELIHKNIHDAVHNRRADGTPLPFEDCEMRKIIESGNRFTSAEEVFVRKNGTTFPVSVDSRPMLDNGEIVASVTAFRDISERIRSEQEREKLIAELQKALAQIKTLHGIVPICASCKKIRDDEGAWHQMEAYISQHTDAQFSHGICKDCAKKLYPEFYKEGEDTSR